MSVDDTLTEAPAVRPGRRSPWGGRHAPEDDGVVRFSPTDAAFAGFSLIRRQPLAILEWAALRLVVNLTLALLLVLLAADRIQQVSDLTAPGSTAPAEDIVAAVAGTLPFFALAIPINLMLHSVMFAAGYRAFLRPRDRGFGYLRFGPDEFRMAVVTVLWVALLLGILLVATFVFERLVSLAGSIGGGMAGLLGLLAAIAFVTVIVWSMVRMSLSWAVSFEQKRISLFSTWRLTQGHFWSVLGAYFLATVLMILVSFAAMAVFFTIATVIALASGVGIASVGAVMKPDASSLGAYFTPGLVIYLAFEALVASAGYAIVLGPTAEAYLVFGKARHARDDMDAAPA